MSLAPGWYDDPDRDPDRQRWWDGDGWSDLTRGGVEAPHGRAALGGTGGTGGRDALGHIAADHVRPGADILDSTRPSGGRPRWGVLLLGAAVVGTIVLAVSLAVGAGDAGVTAGPPPASESVPQGATPPPGTVRIIDPDAGISYDYLGEGWHELDPHPRAEMVISHGQFIVTQESVPDGGQFVAECSSGPLAQTFTIGGAQDFPSAVEALSQSFRANYYPAPNSERVLSSHDVTIDGRPGYLREFDLSWDVAGYDSTGERVAVLLLDTGRPRPAVMYISVPNTHAELYGIIPQLVASVDVI